jgi:hypothetical protein
MADKIKALPEWIRIARAISEDPVAGAHSIAEELSRMILQICNRGTNYKALTGCLMSYLLPIPTSKLLAMVQSFLSDHYSVVAHVVLQAVVEGGPRLVPTVCIDALLQCIEQVVVADEPPSRLQLYLRGFLAASTTQGLGTSARTNQFKELAEKVQAYMQRHLSLHSHGLVPLVELFQSSLGLELQLSQKMAAFQQCVTTGHFAVAERFCNLIFVEDAQAAAWSFIHAEAERRNQRAVALRAQAQLIKLAPPAAAVAVSSGLFQAPALLEAAVTDMVASSAVLRDEYHAIDPPAELRASVIAETSATNLVSIIAKAHRRPALEETLLHLPDIPVKYWQRGLMHLIDNDRIEAAATFVGNSKEMQSSLVEQLLASGRREIAASVWKALSEHCCTHDDGTANDRHDETSCVAGLRSVNVGGKLSIGLIVDVSHEDTRPNSSFELHSWSWPLGEPYGGVGGASIRVVNCYLHVVELKTFFEQSTWKAPSCFFGVDAEWRPERGASGSGWPVSILQVANASHIFIIDLLLLNKLRDELDEDSRVELDHAIEGMLSVIFNNKHILCAGVGIQDDLQRIAAWYPWWGSCLQECNSLVDVAMLHAETTTLLNGRCQSTNRCIRPINAASLSALSNAVLGAPLDKAEQTSDWQCRPLSRGQIVYAAWDAVVSSLLLFAYWTAVGSAMQLEFATDFVLSNARAMRSAGTAPQRQVANRAAYHPCWVAPVIAHREHGPTPICGVAAVCSVLLASGIMPDNAIVEVHGARTAEQGAKMLGVASAQVVKTLAFLAAGSSPIIVLIRGTFHHAGLQM